MSRRRNIDAESIHLLTGNISNGQALISFERNQRVGVFPLTRNGPKAPVRYIRRPAESRRMRSNRGLETVTVVPAGPYKNSIIVFAERYTPKPGHHTGWIWHRGANVRPKTFTLKDLDGFNITDAAALKDGRIIVLERRFRWFEGVRLRLRQIDSRNIKPGAALTGKILLTADMNHEIDNMEGIAIHLDRSGRTILTLISDDNFNTALQRTILLQFALLPNAKRPVPPPNRNLRRRR